MHTTLSVETGDYSSWKINAKKLIFFTQKGNLKSFPELFSQSLCKRLQ